MDRALDQTVDPFVFSEVEALDGFGLGQDRDAAGLLDQSDEGASEA
jgi:hypothetical protein